MKPEDSARKNIDRQLEAAGWRVQDRKNLNLGAALGVAIRGIFTEIWTGGLRAFCQPETRWCGRSKA